MKKILRTASKVKVVLTIFAAVVTWLAVFFATTLGPVAAKPETTNAPIAITYITILVIVTIGAWYWVFNEWRQ